MRKNFIVIASTVLAIHSLFIFAKSPNQNTNPVAEKVVSVENTGNETVNSDAPVKKVSLYQSLNLDKLGLSKQAFDLAMAGYNTMLNAGKLDNENIISIVDFSLASSKKRLFILDLKNEKLVFHTYVAHGRGSGAAMANDFSNVAESHKSSLGFYVTGGTYIGKHGYSLRLNGEERGINDNANSRAIVMHSAAYVSESTIKAMGFIGRSHGCPAVPEALNKPIIEKIKNGSCLFLYSPDKNYIANSSILKKSNKV